MAEQRTKLQTYTQMAEDSSVIVTGSFANWASLMSTAGRFYKYSFLEALMIHLQRPEATACAEYSVWTGRMRRYVRRGAKGIGIIRLIDGKPTLRYVFDVADTGPRKDALYPFLWELRDEYLPSITATLENEFSIPCDGRGLSVQLASIAAQMAEKYWANGKDIITSFAEGCLPDGLAEAFPDAAAASITYMILSRCGLHPEHFFEPDDFASVYKFNAFRSVLALGTAVSKCGGAALRSIETAIRQYERDKRDGKHTKSIVVPDVQTSGASCAEQDSVPEPKPDKPRNVRRSFSSA